MTPKIAVEILQGRLSYLKKKARTWRNTGAMDYPDSKKEVLAWEKEIKAFELAIYVLERF